MTVASQLLGAIMRDRGFTVQRELADFLELDSATVSRIFAESDVRMSTLEKIAEKVDGNLFWMVPPRLRPPGCSSDGAPAAPSPTVLRAGEVVSSDGRIEWLPEDRRSPSALSVEAAIDPERWALGQGPALLLRLGDRLGGWPAGSTVVARAWREGARPPQGLFAAAARSDAWGPGESGWRLRRLLWSDQGGAPRYAAMSLDPLRADADALPADRLQLGAIACGVILPV